MFGGFVILVYKKWYSTKLYKKFIGIDVKNMQEVCFTKDVACDGWYLFGKWPIYLRENI